MKLITESLTEQLLANGRAAREAARAERDLDLKPIVKLFTPDAFCVWLLTELDPYNNDRAYGLCDLGHGLPELGYVSLSELSTVLGKFGHPVERDCHFVADKSISAYVSAAQQRGFVET